MQKVDKNWHLRFAFESKETNIITAVDLGINNVATCSAMRADGTIIGRKIVAFPAEQCQTEQKKAQ